MFVNSEGNMDRNTIEPAIRMILIEIHTKLDEAAQVAKAAKVCAEAGAVDEGARLSLGIDQLLYEAGRLGDAASLLNRLADE